MGVLAHRLCMLNCSIIPPNKISEPYNNPQREEREREDKKPPLIVATYVSDCSARTLLGPIIMILYHLFKRKYLQEGKVIGY